MKIIKDEATKMYKSGSTPTEIANRFGVGVGAVCHFLARNGLRESGCRKRASAEYAKEQREKAIEMYANGFSIPDIASQLKLSVSTISNYFSENGITRDYPGVINRLRQTLNNTIGYLNQREFDEAQEQCRNHKTYTIEDFIPKGEESLSGIKRVEFQPCPYCGKTHNRRYARLCAKKHQGGTK